MENTLHMIKLIPILFSRKYANATGQCLINNVNLIWQINSDNWPLIGNVLFHDAFMWRKMIKKKYYTVRAVQQSHRKSYKQRAFWHPSIHIHEPEHPYTWPLTHIYMTPSTHIHDSPISFLSTCISITSGGVKLVLCVQTSTLRQAARICVSSTCAYNVNPHICNWASSVFVKSFEF